MRNTFFFFFWFWKYVADAEFYARAVEPQQTDEKKLQWRHRLQDKVVNFLVKYGLDFWPTFGNNDLSAIYWSHLELNDEQYVKLQPSSYVIMDEVESRSEDRSVPILDLGCNRGRHLQILNERGFTNLHGIDISGKALRQMSHIFPDLNGKVQLSHMTFQQFLSEASDNSYDIVFSHGVTIEFIHPSFPVVRHLARIAKDYVILAINENGYSYPRFWTYEFARAGYVLVKLLRPAAEKSRVSLLVYRTIS